MERHLLSKRGKTGPSGKQLTGPGSQGKFRGGEYPYPGTKAQGVTPRSVLSGRTAFQEEETASARPGVCPGQRPRGGGQRSCKGLCLWKGPVEDLGTKETRSEGVSTGHPFAAVLGIAGAPTELGNPGKLPQGSTRRRWWVQPGWEQRGPCRMGFWMYSEHRAARPETRGSPEWAELLV